MIPRYMQQKIPENEDIKQKLNYGLSNKLDQYSSGRHGPKISFAIFDQKHVGTKGFGEDLQDARSLELISLTADLYQHALGLTEVTKKEFGNYSVLRLEVDFSISIATRFRDHDIYRSGPDVCQVSLITNLDSVDGCCDGVDMMYKLDSWGHGFLDIMAKKGVKPNWIATDYNFQGIESLRMTSHYKRREDRWLIEGKHPELVAYLDKLVDKYSEKKVENQ